MTIKCHNEFLNTNFSTLNYLKKINDHYDIIKASLIFMSCLKTVWKEGQNRSKLLIFKSLYLRDYLEFLHAVFCGMILEIMPLKL